MCGIAGFLSLNAERPDPARLSRMIATLRHRGPDDTGEVVAGPAAPRVSTLGKIRVSYPSYQRYVGGYGAGPVFLFHFRRGKLAAVPRAEWVGLYQRHQSAAEVEWQIR